MVRGGVDFTGKSSDYPVHHGNNARDESVLHS